MIIGVLILITQFLVFLVNCGKKKASKEPIPLATSSRAPIDDIKEIEEEGKSPITKPAKAKGSDEKAKKEEDDKEKEDDKDNDKDDTKRDDTKKDDKKKSKSKEKDEKEDEDDKKDEKSRTPSKKSAEPGEKLVPHLTTDPPGPLNFKMKMISQIRMTLTNTSDKKIMFKIKFSDSTYQVHPVYGTIEPGKTADLAISHKKSNCKEAKMVIVNSEYTGAEKDLAKAFRNEKMTGEPVTIKLVAK